VRPPCRFDDQDWEYSTLQAVAEPGIEPRWGEQKWINFFVAQKGVYIAKQILHKLQYL
jgi:hypothetical protein